jgi:hypothetical protein
MTLRFRAERDVELVVALVVEVELLELDVEAVVVVSVVVEVLVVVGVFRWVVVVVEDEPPPQTQASHDSSAGQSAALSHCSPASTSIRPSPQVDRGASKSRRLVARALKVPTSAVQEESSTRAFSRTLSRCGEPTSSARRSRVGAPPYGI